MPPGGAEKVLDGIEGFGIETGLLGHLACGLEGICWLREAMPIIIISMWSVSLSKNAFARLKRQETFGVVMLLRLGVCQGA